MNINQIFLIGAIAFLFSIIMLSISLLGDVPISFSLSFGLFFLGIIAISIGMFFLYDTNPYDAQLFHDGRKNGDNSGWWNHRSLQHFDGWRIFDTRDRSARSPISHFLLPLGRTLYLLSFESKI